MAKPSKGKKREQSKKPVFFYKKPISYIINFSKFINLKSRLKKSQRTMRTTSTTQNREYIQVEMTNHR